MPAPDRPPVEAVHRRDLPVPGRGLDMRPFRIEQPPPLERRPVLRTGVPPRPLATALPQEREEPLEIVRHRELGVPRLREKLSREEQVQRDVVPPERIE